MAVVEGETKWQCRFNLTQPSFITGQKQLLRHTAKITKEAHINTHPSSQTPVALECYTDMDICQDDLNWTL